MKFKENKEFLVEKFENENLEELIKSGKFHTKKLELKTLSNGTKISISYIGYKSKVSLNKNIYDYRVDIEKNGISTSLSHVNIIVDIFNKVKNGNLNHHDFREFLIKSSVEGGFNVKDVEQNCPYNPADPGEELKTSIDNIHNQIGKKYNKYGNSWDLTFEELFISILWIVIQEDINYPITNKYLGRKMCFSRYFETLYLFDDSSKTLDEIIKRTLSHARPPQWKEISYKFLDNIFCLVTF